MIFGVYSIRDMKSGFLAPSVEVNDAVAQRNFEHAVLNSEQSLFFSHPEDYVLMKIGEMDSDKGVLFPLVPIEEVITASQVFGSALTARMKGSGMNESEKG